MRYDLTEILTMIDNYRKSKPEKEPVEYSLVDTFQGTLMGLCEHFELMSRCELDNDANRVVFVGKKLLQDALSEIEKTCLIMEAALGDVRILYERESNASAQDILDVVIKNKYVVPKGVGGDGCSLQEERANG